MEFPDEVAFALGEPLRVPPAGVHVASVGSVRPSTAMGHGDSRRTNIGRKKKRYNEQPDRTENRLLAQREVIDAKLAAIRAAKSPATARPREPIT